VHDLAPALNHFLSDNGHDTYNFHCIVLNMRHIKSVKYNSCYVSVLSPLAVTVYTFCSIIHVEVSNPTLYIAISTAMNPEILWI
jgi:hypothetical protein